MSARSRATSNGGSAAAGRGGPEVAGLAALAQLASRTADGRYRRGMPASYTERRAETHRVGSPRGEGPHARTLDPAARVHARAARVAAHAGQPAAVRGRRPLPGPRR